MEIFEIVRVLQLLLKFITMELKQTIFIRVRIVRKFM